MDCFSLLDGEDGHSQEIKGYLFVITLTLSRACPLLMGRRCELDCERFFLFFLYNVHWVCPHPPPPEFCAPPVGPRMVHNHWCVLMMSGCFSFMSPRMNPRSQHKRVIPYDASTVRIPPRSVRRPRFCGVKNRLVLRESSFAFFDESCVAHPTLNELLARS